MRVEIEYKGRKISSYSSLEDARQPLVTLAYDTILSGLKNDLAEWLSEPQLIPLSIQINFKTEVHGDTFLQYMIGNGALGGKMANLARNKSVILNFGFSITDEDGEVASGLFKIKVVVDEGSSELSAARSAGIR